MLLLRTIRVALLFLIVLAGPAFVYAATPSLTNYTVTPTIIYPTASLGSDLATTTTISFGFSERVKVSLKVFDASGSSIKTIYTSSGVTNPDSKHWDGTDTSGQAVSFNTYTLRMVATSTTSGEVLTDTSKTVTIAAPPIETAPASPTTSFSIPLSASWNLISLPLTPTDKNPETVLDTATTSVASVWTYDPSSTAADPNGWLVYDPAHPEISTLTTLDSGYGYFVEAKDAAIITGSGSLFPIGGTPPQRPLSSGWNLIGTYGTSTEAIDSEFSSLGFKGISYTALWEFDGLSQQFKTPSDVRMGKGFWIFLDAPHTYVPANL